jgi:hypothetical protein
VDSRVEREEKGRVLTVYLVNGYWFTLSEAKADELLRLIKNRLCMHFKADAGED